MNKEQFALALNKSNEHLKSALFNCSRADVREIIKQLLRLTRLDHTYPISVQPPAILIDAKYAWKLLRYDTEMVQMTAGGSNFVNQAASWIDKGLPNSSLEPHVVLFIKLSSASERPNAIGNEVFTLKFERFPYESSDEVHQKGAIYSDYIENNNRLSESQPKALALHGSI
jgi:hypothetical protein